MLYQVIPGSKTFLPCWARLVYTGRAGVGGAVFRLGTLRAAVNGVSRIGAGAHWRNMGKCTALSMLANSGTEISRFAVICSGRARFPQVVPACCGAVRLALCCCPLNVTAVHVVRSAAHMNVKNVGFCRVTRFFGLPYPLYIKFSLLTKL